MIEKRVFPDDWSKLTDNQVLENIKYLLENFGKYTIVLPDDKHVNIDNVVIYRDVQKTGEYNKTWYIINNKIYSRESDIGKAIIDLAHFCKMNTISFTKKFSQWFEQIKQTKFNGLTR